MERAQVIEWDPKWSAGDSCPVVLASDRGLTLLYNVAQEEEESVGVVNFLHTRAHRLSGVDDEVLSGHPLYGKGLEFYGAHEVGDSTWLESLKQIHRAHNRYDDARWSAVKHYILCFHDDMLEVLAEGYTIEKRTGTVMQVLESLTHKLVL